MLNTQFTSNDEQKKPHTNDSDSETVSWLWDALKNGATLKDLQNVPDKVMEGIYAHAYYFYQQGRSKDAEVFFRFLCLYDMYNADYMMGLAATFQQQKQYEKAIEAYTVAFGLGKGDYRPMLHAGQCLLLLKRQEAAKELFTVLIESDAPAALKAQAQAYCSAIKSTKPTERKEGTHV